MPVDALRTIRLDIPKQPGETVGAYIHDVRMRLEKERKENLPNPKSPDSFFEAIDQRPNPNPLAPFSHMFTRKALLSYGFCEIDAGQYLRLRFPQGVNGTLKEKREFWESYQIAWLSTRHITRPLDPI